MHSYFAHLSPQHRRSWLLVVAYVVALLAISLADFGANTAGQTMFRGMLLGMLIFLVAWLLYPSDAADALPCVGFGGRG